MWSQNMKWKKAFGNNLDIFGHFPRPAPLSQAPILFSVVIPWTLSGSLGCVYVSQKGNIIEKTKFWLTFYFFFFFFCQVLLKRTLPSAFYFLDEGDHKGHGTQGQGLGISRSRLHCSCPSWLSATSLEIAGDLSAWWPVTFCSQRWDLFQVQNNFLWLS